MNNKILWFLLLLLFALALMRNYENIDLLTFKSYKTTLTYFFLIVFDFLSDKIKMTSFIVHHYNVLIRIHKRNCIPIVSND